MTPILEIQNISKKFRIHHEHQPYLSFRDKISSLLRSSSKADDEEFWALKNIRFEVSRGESLGIIGKNGAGKSTLLKILSKITPPTSGKIISRGRIASLLEVGTGFHPELTGKENVFLNGSILGMKQKEIEKKFDEIVDFSGVEKFLDTPLKHYSSGMQLRLAFAVAAFLEPEILVIDEVLAVGDSEFQKKCINKMGEISKDSGRTILFVSHNMAAIQNLCNKVAYLNKGELETIGNPDQVISHYLSDAAAVHSIQLADRKDRRGNGSIRFVSTELTDMHNEKLQAFQSGRAGVFNIKLERKKNTEVRDLKIAMGIDDEFGQRITHLNNDATNQTLNLTGSESIVQIVIDKLPLKQGRYSFTLFSTVNGEIADWIQDAGSFQVESGDFFNTGKLPPESQGNFYINHQFMIKQD